MNVINQSNLGHRLKRAFGINIETYEKSGHERLQRALTNRQVSRFAQRMLPARVRHREVFNENSLVSQKILSHLDTNNNEVVKLLPPQSRAAPQTGWFE
jgi:hypothetical protein